MYLECRNHPGFKETLLRMSSAFYYAYKIAKSWGLRVQRRRELINEIFRNVPRGQVACIHWIFLDQQNEKERKLVQRLQIVMNMGQEAPRSRFGNHHDPIELFLQNIKQRKIDFNEQFVSYGWIMGMKTKFHLDFLT